MKVIRLDPGRRNYLCDGGSPRWIVGSATRPSDASGANQSSDGIRSRRGRAVSRSRRSPEPSGPRGGGGDSATSGRSDAAWPDEASAWIRKSSDDGTRGAGNGWALPSGADSTPAPGAVSSTRMHGVRPSAVPAPCFVQAARDVAMGAAHLLVGTPCTRPYDGPLAPRTALTEFSCLGHRPGGGG